MQLIVISSPENLPQEAAIINQLFDAGMQLFHLRKPGQSEAEVSNLLSCIEPEYHSKIGLHQYHFLAAKNSISRLHFTEQERKKTSTEYLQVIKKEGFILSTSVHQVQIISAQQDFDYVFLSPVFNSISKQGYSGFADTSFTVQKLANRPEVFALGGIDATNIHQLKTMNFDGAAVLGSIWQNPEQAVSNFKILQQRCLEMQIAATKTSKI